MVGADKLLCRACCCWAKLELLKSAAAFADAVSMYIMPWLLYNDLELPGFPPVILLPPMEYRSPVDPTELANMFGCDIPLGGGGMVEGT